MSERRSSPRVRAAYPARLKGTDVNGMDFKEETLLENLSGRGSFLPLTHQLPVGSEVSLAVRLSTAPAGTKSALLAAKGIVRRVDQQTDGSFGTALQFSRRRIL